MATLSLDGNLAKMETGGNGTMLAQAKTAPALTGRAALEGSIGEGAGMRSSLAAESKPAAAPAKIKLATAPLPMAAPTLDSAALAELSGGSTGDVSGDGGGATPSANADARVAAGFAAIGEPMPLKPTISADNGSQMLVAPTLGSMALSGWR
jgi:hypothetical protein